jgi:hypothetical protein
VQVERRKELLCEEGGECGGLGVLKRISKRRDGMNAECNVR